MAFGNKNRGRQKHDHEPQPLARIALTVTSMDNSDPDNPVMKVSLADGTRDTLGISADSPEIQFVMHEDHRKDGGLKGLFGKLPGAAQSQEVKEGYTFWADAIRKINDNTISGEWYGTFFGVGAQKNAEEKGQGMPLRMDGTVKTTRFAPKDDQDARWEATMIWPDAAAQVGSKADLQTQLEATLGQEGPGEKVAYVRFSTAAGETRDCGVFIGYNKDEERRQTPSEAVKGWMTRSHDGQKIDDYFAEANAVEVIPGTRLQMGAATANGVETNFLEQMGKRKFAIGSSKVTVAEIPASKRLDAPSGQPDERPSDRQMDYIKAISTNRGRKIPDEVERSQLAASAWIGQNQVSLGWQRGQIICRPDYKDKNGNMFALAIGVCHERRAGMPLAAVPTPAAPNAPQFAAEAAREIARERDSILTGEARVLEERRQDQQVDTRVETGKASELEPPASHDDLEEDAGMRPGG